MKKLNVAFSSALGIAVFALNSFAANPVVTWASYPVGKGDRVILHGADWGENPRVKAMGKSFDAKVLSDSGLVFPFPANSESIVEGRVVSENGASKPFTLNAPTVWWLQGEDGRDASAPGGLLRIFGRSLAPHDNVKGARVRVRLGKRELTLEKSDVWSIIARVPADVKPGKYPVFVSNGLSGGKDWYEAGTWTVAVRRDVWKSTVFNVLDYGADPNDDVCDSDAFDAAMAAAAKNGGGTVFVPYGRYKLTRTLVIPPYVLLKGEDRALSQIVWPDMQNNPPENLIEGSHSFGIHDLFISSGQYRNGIVAKNEMSSAGVMASQRGVLTHDISLKRLRVKLVSDQFREERNLQNFLPRYSMRGDGITVRNCLRGEIEDCDIYCDKDAQRTLFFKFTGDYIRMANCRINGSGWAIFGGDRCIFENNFANNCTYSISSVCSRMFWSGNRQTDLYTNNREAVTHDGAKTAWNVKKRGENGCASGSANGTHVTLTYPDNFYWRSATNENAWVGWELQITDGRGVGQTRSIVGMKNKNELEIDRPFDITPDATSLFVVVAERKHLIYVDNDIEDAGVAIQLYGGVTDCVVARNKCRRAGGFHGSGRDYHGVIVCWYVQFLDNVIEEGNCHRGSIGTDYKGTGASLIGAFPPNVRWPFSQTYVYKGNEIKSNGSLFISVKNALVEKNTVRRSDVGVMSKRYQDTMYVADNVFDRVELPYHNLDGAFITPEYVDKSREKYLAMIKDGTLAKHRTATAMRRAFGFVVTPQPWNDPFRNVVGGRSHAPFKLPFTIKIHGVLADDVRQLRVRVPSAGGWDFGGEIVLTKKGDEYAGEVAVTPPKEGAVGMFTWPMKILVTGDDWSFETEVVVNPLSQNRFVQWESGLAAPGNKPSRWRKLAYNEGMDGHESLFAEKIWGNELSGKDCFFRTAVKVFHPTRFSFVRGDATCSLFVDGKCLISEGRPLWSDAVVMLEPGNHVLEIVRPATTKYPRNNKDGACLKCSFPSGCTAGDWVMIAP